MSYGPPNQPGAGRVVVWAGLGAIVTAVLGLFLGLLGASIGVAVRSATAGICWRGLLSMLVVVVASRVLLERGVRLELAQPAIATVGVTALGYALDPLTWEGRAVFTQLVVAPGLSTVVGDLALWAVASGVGVFWGLRGLDDGPDGGLAGRAPVRRPTRGVRADRGAASIEWTGAVLICSAVVVAVSLAFVGRVPVIGSTVRWVICEIVTLGQGGCARQAAQPDPHVPTKPCVLQSSATTISREIAVFSVKGGQTNRFEIAKLSDGRYRITELKGGSIGVEAGVGAGVSVTYNDQTYGASAIADASAQLGIQNGRTWYTNSQAEADRLIGNLRVDAIEDTVAGASPTVRPVLSGARWLVDQVTGHDSSLPPPDEALAQGGVILNASAEATGTVAGSPTPAGGAASVGLSTLLGARTTRDGHTTVYVSTQLDGSATAQMLQARGLDIASLGGGASGKLTLVTAMTLDSAGNLVEVSTTGAASGQTGGVVNALFGNPASTDAAEQVGNGIVFQSTLPIKSQADAVIAGQFFLASGITQLNVGTLGVLDPTHLIGGTAAAVLPGATLDFIRASGDHGTITRQHFSENSGNLGINAEGGAGVEVGGGASYETLDRTSTDAAYFDGTGWVPWKGCS